MELKFDFYELGTWDGDSSSKGPDSLQVKINSETIDLGTYHKKNVDELYLDTSQEGFTVTRTSDSIANLCSGSGKDQVHHFSIKFPGTKLNSPLGKIKVTFKPDVKSDGGVADVAGFDNVQIITNDCDSDHDGVSILLDKCPNTVTGATVEEISPKRDVGCSAEEILDRDCPIDGMGTHEYVYCIMNKAKKLMNRGLMVKALQDDMISVWQSFVYRITLQRHDWPHWIIAYVWPSSGRFSFIIKTIVEDTRVDGIRREFNVFVGLIWYNCIHRIQNQDYILWLFILL